MPTQSDAVVSQTKRAPESIAVQILEAQQRLVMVSYDKAATYTAVIIFGGYAGMFALWQLTKEYLSKSQALWAALLVLVSLVAFVLFEVGKMVLVARLTFSKVRVLNSHEVKSNPQSFLRMLEDIERTQSAVLFPFMVAWAVAVSICVLGALSAVGILGYAFICGLAK
jgi:hypothetical protein